MQVMYLGRAPCTKESLPDFLKWCRVTRHPLVFRRLTGSQRTPGNGVSHYHSYCVMLLLCPWQVGHKVHRDVPPLPLSYLQLLK